MSFYENVVAYCEKNGLTKRGFEKLCDLPNGTYRNWEIRSANPTVSTLQKIEAATKIPIKKWLA